MSQYVHPCLGSARGDTTWFPYSYMWHFRTCHTVKMPRTLTTSSTLLLCDICQHMKMFLNKVDAKKIEDNWYVTWEDSKKLPACDMSGPYPEGVWGFWFPAYLSYEYMNLHGTRRLNGHLYGSANIGSTCPHSVKLDMWHDWSLNARFWCFSRRSYH